MVSEFLSFRLSELPHFKVSKFLSFNVYKEGGKEVGREGRKQTNKQTNKHYKSMTESAHWVDTVQILKENVLKTMHFVELNLWRSVEYVEFYLIMFY